MPTTLHAAPFLLTMDADNRVTVDGSRIVAVDNADTLAAGHLPVRDRLTPRIDPMRSAPDAGKTETAARAIAPGRFARREAWLAANGGGSRQWTEGPAA